MYGIGKTFVCERLSFTIYYTTTYVSHSIQYTTRVSYCTARKAYVQLVRSSSKAKETIAFVYSLPGMRTYNWYVVRKVKETIAFVYSLPKHTYVQLVRSL